MKIPCETIDTQVQMTVLKAIGSIIDNSLQLIFKLVKTFVKFFG